jgi:hypothetical protein
MSSTYKNVSYVLQKIEILNYIYVGLHPPVVVMKLFRVRI